MPTEQVASPSELLSSAEVDTSIAGVTVVIADGSENTVTGTNIYRMLKTKYKNEDSPDAIKIQKKMRKLDAIRAPGGQNPPERP